MVTHYKLMLWHNIIGRLLKPSFPSGICPPYYSWDLDTNLLCTRRNSAANQRSHIEPEKNVQGFLILPDVILTGLPTCPNNLQSTYQSGMPDFRDIVEFCASAQLSAGTGSRQYSAVGMTFVNIFKASHTLLLP